MFLFFSARYLGETPEWEFIQQDEEHLLPFKINRDTLCKQRVSNSEENHTRMCVFQYTLPGARQANPPERCPSI